MESRFWKEWRPVVVVDVPQLAKILLVCVIPASLAHVVPGKVLNRAVSPKAIVKSEAKLKGSHSCISMEIKLLKLAFVPQFPFIFLVLVLLPLLTHVPSDKIIFLSSPQLCNSANLCQLSVIKYLTN